MLDTPVLLLVFNRPDTTAQVFEAIRQAQPRRLFIAADGPRLSRPDDAPRCSQVLEIVGRVDWTCEVKTLFRESNLGCKYAVSSAIDWFFAHVEEGIILEDDCLPDESFFHFCSQLLTYYRHNTSVMHISGSNWNPGGVNGAASYFCSKYPNIWGWATWRRAWQHYDVEMQSWPSQQKNLLRKQVFASRREFTCWRDFFHAMRTKKVDTWDTQWIYAVWQHGGTCITPKCNLVKNIGMNSPAATHTTGANATLAGIGVSPLSGAIVHPASLSPERQHDEYLFRHLFWEWREKTTLKQLLHDRLYRFLPDNVKTYYRSFKLITRGS